MFGAPADFDPEEELCFLQPFVIMVTLAKQPAKQIDVKSLNVTA
jgi:hypothetical protein